MSEPEAGYWKKVVERRDETLQLERTVKAIYRDALKELSEEHARLTKDYEAAVARIAELERGAA